MPYARLDDRYDDHPKIREAMRRDPAAVAVHVMAITYCSRHVTDGIIPSSELEANLKESGYYAAKRRRILDTLLELKLLERVDERTLRVHDFLDWNLSRLQRKTLADQGRNGGRKTSRRASPGSSPDVSPGSSTPTPRPTLTTPPKGPPPEGGAIFQDEQTKTQRRRRRRDEGPSAMARDLADASRRDSQ